MAEAKKVEPASGWPTIAGDYDVGDPKGSIAICTLASEGIYKALAKIPGVAIAGPCKTENIGLEKIAANLLANPNIRFLISCGIEVTGHVTGGSLKALFEKGIDTATKKIKDAPGAIPYVEHLTVEAVERLQKQVSLVDMISVEDAAKIKSKVEELVKQNPEAFPQPPYLVKLLEEKKEAEVEFIMPLAPTLTPSLKTMTSIIEDMRYKVQLIGRERRLTTAVNTGRIFGLAIGFALSLSILAGLLLFAIWG